MATGATRRDRISGRTRFVADLDVPGALYAAVARSPVPHAQVRHVWTTGARAVPGVVAVVTAADVTARLTGRRVRDVPVLAGERVRFVGEPVAAVVATTRRAAEAGVRAVQLDLRRLPAVLGPEAALAPDAPRVHEQAHAHQGSVAQSDWHPNLQSSSELGDAAAVAAALDRAAHVVDLRVTCASGHHGYLEQHACVATWDGRTGRVWMTGKSPYAARRQLAALFDVAPGAIEMMPAPVGGDFGGKGSPLLAPLCMELSRIVGQPVRLVLRYGEDLVATNPRHPGTLHVRLGCDVEGRLVGASLDALLDGGAHAGMKPRASVDLGGVVGALRAYDLPTVHVRSRIAYTTTVPRGHMRAPGHPQASFAIEQALDELALRAGLSPLDLRAANLVAPGQPTAVGGMWRGGAGPAVIEAARGPMAEAPPPMPDGPGWVAGRGVATCLRLGPAGVRTSMRVVPVGDRLRAEVPFPDTGSGSDGVVARLLAEALGTTPDRIDVVQVSTAGLPDDAGVGHSRVTLAVARAVDQVARAWGNSTSPVAVELDETGEAPPATHCAQVVDVAVDLETGEVRVLRVATVIEVGRVVDDAAHDMQVDAGVVMGLGFALLEDLDEVGGHVRADSLSSFHLPTTLDRPELQTLHVPAADPTQALPVGELTNVAVAPAVANAIRSAIGHRPLRTPICAEDVYTALRPGRATCTSE